MGGVPKDGKARQRSSSRSRQQSYTTCPHCLVLVYFLARLGSRGGKHARFFGILWSELGKAHQ
eukprot:9500814-Pyramimonas_sp.AAC.1